MSTYGDVHVRICGQEIIKYDLEIKALIQVRLKPCFGAISFIDPNFLFSFTFERCTLRLVDFSDANARLKFKETRNKNYDILRITANDFIMLCYSFHPFPLIILCRFFYVVSSKRKGNTTKTPIRIVFTLIYLTAFYLLCPFKRKYIVDFPHYTDKVISLILKIIALPREQVTVGVVPYYAPPVVKTPPTCLFLVDPSIKRFLGWGDGTSMC